MITRRRVSWSLNRLGCVATVLALAGTLAATAVAGAGPGSIHRAQALNIRFASAVPAKTATGQAAARIASALAQQKDFDVQSYLGSTLYNQTQLPQAVGTGAVDLAVSAGDSFAATEPSLAVSGLPLLWSTADQAEAAITGPLKPELSRLFAKHGLVYLGALLFGPVNIFGGNKSLHVPADLRGQKIRSATTIFSKTLEAYGASPVVIDSTETYTALQRGTVDGAFSAAVSFAATGWDQVIKYATDVPLNFSFWPVVANARWWSSLTPAQQKTIRVVVESASKGVPSLLASWDADAIAKMKSAGVTVYRVPAKQYPQWRNPLSSVYNYYYSSAGAEGRKLVRLATEVVVTTIVSGKGEIVGRGVRCHKVCRKAYASDARVTLHARPAKGYRFTGWRGACNGRKACTIKPTNPTKVTAVFRKRK